MSFERFFSAEEILIWRKQELSKGGRAVDLDWLLDIGGGLGWSTLQELKIFQSSFHKLDLSLEELSLIWMRHLSDQIPLQHLVGKCPWRDFELKVNSSALIPRQETEILIDIALKKVDAGLMKYGRWADLGTGSGALAVALARALPLWEGHAADCCNDALALAESNINTLTENANVSLHLGDWWEPLKPWWGNFDLVVANPPYIPKTHLSELDPVVRDHEPILALSGGDDGMDSCRKVIKGAMKGLRSGGWLLLEHNFDQSEQALNLMVDSGFLEVDFENDLEGVRRFGLALRP
ncbi:MULTISPECIES: peptide chain release factor N(5)-glutamine methyltransferase [Prochlorococcus]|uniref:Release factor glutamine methyltransferase n=1 Tax=Prochlorococcus marinus (strain SARG / CCMP1375 / SS120) TaxID=167539 RepID=PRMC_PROMA|nr:MULTISPECIES: peptide chain release factor N(5)-glutamine methyltransferase [Prochlorococcus]Q7VDL7.1 RecName: Full=Release factor glutamine methyltransferase; Short=RF MTase; AltName: Full=N5-glutamine methyltransferase PrmC; AltName: Full=Protein-(glutamine-N5) MTase PrmC; AltName: Full=Protein-glutamine N-methyltransferase PrmC [Prochlorococcus marinus subsp. marinus str. CCMP1375]AAP99405.1 Methylase of polypeptide chain release factor [Prochlorococcus marinus subsp. marinus str. CCMP1375]